MILVLIIIILLYQCNSSIILSSSSSSSTTTTSSSTSTSSSSTSSLLPLIIENPDNTNDITNRILPQFNANDILLYYHYVNSSSSNISTILSYVLNICDNNIINDNNDIIINDFIQYYHMNILDIHNNNSINNNNNNNLYWNISNELNKCYYLYQNNDYISDILLYVSVVIWPSNHVAMKYLGIKLINYGFYNAALTLYNDCIIISDDYGCILYHVFIIPSHYISYNHTTILFYNIMIKVKKALTINSNSNILDPTNFISSTPIYMQYLGISSRILSESYSKVINHMFPVLRQSLLSSDNTIRNITLKNTIRLGIVSEVEMNSSPGLCFTSILPRLRIQSIERNDGREIEIIFFARANSITVFANVAMKTANKVVILNLDDFQASYKSILFENLDVLLYLGLPTNDKYTSFLSQMRLAPIQMQFAVGHPLTSGSLAIDYSISSVLFQETFDVFKTKEVDADKCLGMLNDNDNDFIASCAIQGPQANTYVEQLVLFDTMTYHIQDPVDFYKETSSFLNTKTMKEATHAQCQDLDDYLDYIQFNKWNITSTSFGCGNANSSSIRLYMLVQTSRKLHPLMDDAIYQILMLDPNARIIVNSNSKDVLLFRTSKQASLHIHNIQTRLIPIEERIDHKNYLRLLALSSVFLNPFPYGSGITSAEAIAFCIPIILFPKSISYIQLALGQLRMLRLPSDIEELYIAESINDYANKAVRAAIQRQEHNVDHYCMNKNRDNLFSAVQLEDTVNEWINFLRYIVIGLN